MLRTSVSGLTLSPLNDGHCVALFDLIRENHSFLTAHGDYTDEVSRSFEMLKAELSKSTIHNLCFGIMLNQRLIGRIDLVPIDPPCYGLGYWLAQSSTGKGYATAGVEALMAFARDDLQATDVYAGVTHSNQRSMAVLERVGFQPVANFKTFTRFHRALRHT